MNNKGSLWSRSTTPMRVTALVVLVLGFAILFILSRIYGQNQRDFVLSLGYSLIYSLLVPLTLAGSLLLLAVGKSNMQEKHLAWQQESSLLLGIGEFFIAIGLLVSLIFIYLLYRPAISFGLFISSIAPFFIAGFIFFIWSVVASNLERMRNKDNRDSGNI